MVSDMPGTLQLLLAQSLHNSLLLSIELKYEFETNKDNKQKVQFSVNTDHSSTGQILVIFIERL